MGLEGGDGCMCMCFPVLCLGYCFFAFYSLVYSFFPPQWTMATATTNDVDPLQ